MALINRSELAPVLKSDRSPCDFEVTEKNWDNAGHKLFTRTHCPRQALQGAVHPRFLRPRWLSRLGAAFGDMVALWARPTDEQFDAAGGKGKARFRAGRTRRALSISASLSVEQKVTAPAPRPAAAGPASGAAIAARNSCNSRGLSAPSVPFSTSQFEAWSLRKTVRFSSSAESNCSISRIRPTTSSGAQSGNFRASAPRPCGKLTTRVARNSGWAAFISAPNSAHAVA